MDMDVKMSALTVRDRTHVACSGRLCSEMKMEEPAPYHVEGDSQKSVGLSTLLTGLSGIPLKTLSVSG